MHETLARSSLGALGEGSPVNLELALRAEDRLGGHIVQGHVDGDRHGHRRRPRTGSPGWSRSGRSGAAALRGREGVGGHRRRQPDRQPPRRPTTSPSRSSPRRCSGRPSARLAAGSYRQPRGGRPRQARRAAARSAHLRHLASRARRMTPSRTTTFATIEEAIEEIRQGAHDRGRATTRTARTRATS